VQTWIVLNPDHQQRCAGQRERDKHAYRKRGKFHLRNGLLHICPISSLHGTGDRSVLDSWLLKIAARSA
jgi:hypothetical protein